jgi:DNA-binding NtrC family response regulator
MPAAVLVVHNEPNTRELAVTALRAAFLDVIGFDDPMAALNAIEDDTRIRVLVTRVAFGAGKLNGVALARMVRVKRPGTKVVFVARAEKSSHTEGLAWISQTRTYQGGEPGRHLHFSGTQDLVCW